MKSILDPSFRYVSSRDTDLRKTFARLRREQRKRAAGALANVLPFAESRAPSFTREVDESLLASARSTECRT